MSLRARLSGGLLGSLMVFATARPAHAVLDPSEAQADVQAAQREKAFPFCSDPREPLSPRARALCPHASETPGCEGFAAACAKSDEPVLPTWWRWIRWLPLGAVARLFVWVLVAVVALAVIVPIAAALVRMRRNRELADSVRTRDPAAPPHAPDVSTALPEDDLVALLARAEGLARRGERAAALALYLAASLRALDKRGALRLGRDRTNGEYVRLCTDEGAARQLRDIVREVDRVQFGREDATPEAVARTATRAHTIVRALPVALLGFVLVTLLLGCSGSGRTRAWIGRAGDDPAGDELFEAMLRRQGLRAEPLGASLAAIPLPQPGEPSPGVMVDVERVPLDAETRSHLVEWVDAGGVLVLAGSPETWPPEFGAVSATTCAPGDLRARGPAGSGTERGALAGAAALRAPDDSHRVGWFGDDSTYAAVVFHRSGSVLAIASDELFTNVGLSRPDNAAVAAVILSNADCSDLKVAHAEDGSSAPSTPVGALVRAGLGLGLVHALVAAVVLFLAVGVRMVRAKPAPPPPRRAFVEHVDAVGGLYARTRSAPHALAVYARFADERLRARMPRGTSDVAAYLASRAHQPLAVCRRVWERAMGTRVDEPPVGDELRVLRELSVIYEAAAAGGQVRAHGEHDFRANFRADERGDGTRRRGTGFASRGDARGVAGEGARARGGRTGAR